MYIYISEKTKRGVHFIVVGVILIFGVFGIIHSIYVYPKVFGVEISVQNRKEISPKETIRVNFSQPMIADETVRSLKIEPEIEIESLWLNNQRTLLIKPVAYWESNQMYNISFHEAKSIMFTKTNADFYFETPTYPKVSSFYPISGSEDILLDIEDPIKVTFNKEITQFKTKFIIEPLEDLAYKLDEEKKIVSLIPKGEMRRGEKYEISVYIRHRDEPDDNYFKIYTASFKTLPPPPPSWDKDKNLRLEQAKKFTNARIRNGRYIDINVTSQVMTIFEDGKLLDAYLISSGKSGMPTPLGEFSIRNKYPRAWSKKYSLYMPYWMAIVPSGQFGIHELPEWPGGYKEGQNHLGIPVSHGCIRLGIGPAERVYNWTEIGTPVIVHN